MCTEMTVFVEALLQCKTAVYFVDLCRSSSMYVFTRHQQVPLQRMAAYPTIVAKVGLDLTGHTNILGAAEVGSDAQQ